MVVIHLLNVISHCSCSDSAADRLFLPNGATRKTGDPQPATPESGHLPEEEGEGGRRRGE